GAPNPIPRDRTRAVSATKRTRASGGGDSEDHDGTAPPGAERTQARRTEPKPARPKPPARSRNEPKPARPNPFPPDRTQIPAPEMNPASGGGVSPVEDDDVAGSGFAASQSGRLSPGRTNPGSADRTQRSAMAVAPIVPAGRR